MLRLLGRVLLVIALTMAIGLHWLVLQSVAWTAMVVKYSKQQPLRVAICQTLDGDHPCALCHVVSKGKNSEKKSDLQVATPKIDMICATRGFCLAAQFVRLDYALRDLFARQTGKSPPVPPPRFMRS